VAGRTVTAGAVKVEERSPPSFEASLLGGQILHAEEDGSRPVEYN
jgi:hypothetical protein